MHDNKKKQLLAQIGGFRARFAQSVETVSAKAIPGERPAAWISEDVGRYRERRYSPLMTLTLFIEQVLSADHSCQDAVGRGLSSRVAAGLAPVSLNTGAYCRARYRLPYRLPRRLAREIGDALLAHQPSSWRWRGREVKLIDGTAVSMPDTNANQARFPRRASQTSGCGFPIARLVAIVSLSRGAVLEWALSPYEGKNTGETALLWRLKERLRPGDVVIADRYYTSYFLICALRLWGVDVVFRQQGSRKTDFRRGEKRGVRDHVVSWCRPARPDWMEEATYATMPETIALREVRIGGYTIVTTFTDAQDVHKDELLVLYRQRWQLELDLRAIKTVMQMDVLRCKTPTMVEKEIAVHFLAYNLVRTVMAQAAAISDQRPRRLSFKAALQLLNAFEMNLRHAPHRVLAERCALLLKALAQCRLPDRPNRVEPRLVKRRPRWTKWLQTPRPVLRARLRRRQQRRARCA